MDVISKREAEARGEKLYFTGKPCVRGHISPRNVAGGMCRECHRENARQRIEQNPQAHRDQVKRSRRKHPEKHAERQKKWYQENRRKVRNSVRDRRYGLAPGQFEKMLEAQQNQCASCREDFLDEPNVDHDHTTGAVRGLLCGSCNRAAGQVGDDPVKLRALANYLDRHSSADTPQP